MDTLAFNLFIAFISSMGFALMFNMPKKWLIPASMGGLGSWAVYLFCQVFMGEVVFVPCLIASVFSAIYAWTLSQFSEAPFSMYFMIAVVPLIPGSGLYYTIFNLAQGNTELVRHFARLTTDFALAISIGMSVVWALIEIHRKYDEVKNNK